jgi:broad specificity phosphatase PhoE
MVNIIIVRHGETDSNKEKVMMGQSDVPLNESGHLQAYNLGKYLLSNYTIKKIYSSDLKRAVQTTREILKFYPDYSPIYMKELRERAVGSEFVGKPYQIYDNFIRDGTPNGKFNIKKKAIDGESIIDFYNRVKQSIEKIFSEISSFNNDENVLLISHGGFIRVLLGYLFYEKNCGLKSFLNYFPTDIMNCSITVIGYNNQENRGIYTKPIGLRYANFFQYQ